MSAKRKKSQRSFEAIRRTVIQTTAKAWGIEIFPTWESDFSGKLEHSERTPARGIPRRLAKLGVRRLSFFG